MKTRKKYSKEFKLDAVNLVLEHGYSRAEAARSLELDPQLFGGFHVDLNKVGVVMVSTAKLQLIGFGV